MNKSTYKRLSSAIRAGRATAGIRWYLGRDHALGYISNREFGAIQDMLHERHQHRGYALDARKKMRLDSLIQRFTVTGKPVSKTEWHRELVRDAGAFWIQ